MKLTTSIFCMFIFTLSSFSSLAQDKRPEAMPDYFNVVADVVYTLKPLVNDIVDAGHTARIFRVIGSNAVTLGFNDSIINYRINAGYKGEHVIHYGIQDMQNGLFSDLATITLNVSNHAFDTLDINNIRATVNPYGTAFFNIFNMEGVLHYEFPQGSGLNTMFCMGLNLSGTKDGGGSVLSGALYQQFGSDFFPGPVSMEAFYGQAYDSAWRKVWKLDKSQIENHIRNYSREGYEIPFNIRTWPANGHAESGQASVLAPYHDYNDNGVYDPENGDYPLIRGDQTIYYIYNDIRSAHTDFLGFGMGAEVHCMVYAFSDINNPALNNTIFVNYMVINRSQDVLSELRFSVFADADLGYWGDDYVGCDTTRNMAFIYNGDDNDEISGNGYGSTPPAQSVMLLNRKMTGFLPLMAYPSPSWSFDPTSGQELVNVMNGLWKDGAPLIGNGCGHPSCAQGDTVAFVFSGDPSLAGSWSEWQEGTLPGDRRMIFHVEPVYDFRPGDAVCIDLALTTARETSGNHIDSYVLLKEYATLVQSFYNENLPASCFDVAPGYNEILASGHRGQLLVYPNPAVDFAGLKSETMKGRAEFRIIDLTGRQRFSGILPEIQHQLVDVKFLEPGIYIIQVFSSEGMFSAKLIKR